MHTTYFNQRAIDRMRHSAVRAARLPNDLPEGWCRSPVDPVDIVEAFPSLKLKKGLVLRGYVFRSQDNGNGMVWAMPAASGFTKPSNCPIVKNSLLEAPKPLGAIDAMEAIDGDGTPLSFLSASLLAREFREFGAEWHGCWWSTHKILCGDPWAGELPKQLAEEMGDPGRWEWTGPKPAEWRAAVTEDGDIREVAFHSFTGLERQRIERHVDRYRRGSYVPEPAEQTIATGPGGYIP